MVLAGSSVFSVGVQPAKQDAIIRAARMRAIIFFIISFPFLLSPCGLVDDRIILHRAKVVKCFFVIFSFLYKLTDAVVNILPKLVIMHVKHSHSAKTAGDFPSSAVFNELKLCKIYIRLRFDNESAGIQKFLIF